LDQYKSLRTQDRLRLRE